MFYSSIQKIVKVSFTWYIANFFVRMSKGFNPLQTETMDCLITEVKRR